MEEFKQSLMSTNWWLSAVIVGVLVNVASAYLKTPLDRLISRLYRAWQNRSSESSARFRAEIELLIESPSRRMILWRSEVRGKLRASICLALACFFLLTDIFRKLHGNTSTLQAYWPEIDSFRHWPALIFFVISLFSWFHAEYLRMKHDVSEELAVDENDHLKSLRTAKED